VLVEYSQFEIFIVAVSVSIPLQYRNLAVNGLQFSGADTMIVPVQNERLPYQQLPGGIFKYSDSTGGGLR